MRVFYIAIDGDDVGRQIEYLVVNNKSQQLSEFSTKYEYAMVWLEQQLKNILDVKIIFRGGDSLLCTSSKEQASIEEEINSLKKEFIDLVEVTLSVGIGSSLREAYFALKLAKANGKNRITLFDQSLEQSYE